MSTNSIWIANSIFMGGGGGSTPSELIVQDENTTINNTVSTINFMGDSVQVENVNSSKVNIYIPPQVFVSHFNNNDGSNITTVNNITTYNRYVANPLGLYEVGDWSLSSYHSCLREATLFYSTINQCSFPNLSSSLTVTVYGANGTSPLAIHSKTNISNNSDNTSSNIRIVISNWASDGSKFKAIVEVYIYIGLILPNSGRFSIDISHSTIDGTFNKTQNDLFFDSQTYISSIGSVGILENSVVSSKYLSGLRYYSIGDLFDISILDIDYLNSNTFLDDLVEVYPYSEYGIPNYQVQGTDLTSYNTNYNNIDSSLEDTKAISRTNFRYIGTQANIQARTLDWDPTSFINSSNASIMIDTFGQESNSLSEYFTDEIYRRTSLDASWDSQQSLLSYDDTIGLMIQSGLLMTRRGNWTSYKPSGNYNYSSFSGWGTYYRRFIDELSLVRGSGNFTITGFTLQDLIDEKIKIFLTVPGRFSGWGILHGSDTFDAGSFTGVEGDPIRTADSSSNIIRFSMGTLGLTSSQNYLRIRIEISTAYDIQPSSIILSW